MTTDPFTDAARAEALRAWVKESDRMDSIGTLGAHMAEWARTHLAAQRAEEVRAWAVQQYPSGTPLDQDRRMVAAETEAYLSGRSERDMSDLAQAAKHAGPVDPPAQEPTDAEVLAALNADYAIRFGPRNLPADSLEPYGDEAVRIMRAALSAARRDEKGKP